MTRRPATFARCWTHLPEKMRPWSRKSNFSRSGNGEHRSIDKQFPCCLIRRDYGNKVRSTEPGKRASLLTRLYPAFRFPGRTGTTRSRARHNLFPRREMYSHTFWRAARWLKFLPVIRRESLTGTEPSGTFSRATNGGRGSRAARNYPLRKLGAALLQSDGRTSGDATPGCGTRQWQNTTN